MVKIIVRWHNSEFVMIQWNWKLNDATDRITWHRSFVFRLITHTWVRRNQVHVHWFNSPHAQTPNTHTLEKRKRRREIGRERTNICVCNSTAIYSTMCWQLNRQTDEINMCDDDVDNDDDNDNDMLLQWFSNANTNTSVNKCFSMLDGEREWRNSTFCDPVKWNRMIEMEDTSWGIFRKKYPIRKHPCRVTLTEQLVFYLKSFARRIPHQVIQLMLPVPVPASCSFVLCSSLCIVALLLRGCTGRPSSSYLIHNNWETYSHLTAIIKAVNAGTCPIDAFCFGSVVVVGINGTINFAFVLMSGSWDAECQIFTRMFSKCPLSVH